MITIAKKLWLKIGAVFLGVVIASVAVAQPFAAEIKAFKKQDSVAMPAAGAVLLVGSSSFTKWTNVQSYFPQIRILNRGFGGSSLPHVIDYSAQIIYPYKPLGIFIYCGENDLASDDMPTPKTVTKRFKTLYKGIRKELGNIPVVFVSIKPSPSRRHLLQQVIETNRRIKKITDKKNNLAYVDVFSKMLNADGRSMPEIFTSDSLHMNEKGYAIWQKAMEPVMEDIKDGKLDKH